MSRRDTSVGGRKPRGRRAGASVESGAEPTQSDASEETARQRTDAGADVSEQLSFESALEALESVVDRLEEGDLELEGALASFEQGVRLARRCAGQLESAERRIEILMSEGGEWMERPFDARADTLDEESEDSF